MAAPIQLLTSEQINSVMNTWKVPSATPVESGVLLLTRFFEKFPHYQEYFKAFKNIPLDSLKDNSAFRGHASKIVNVVNDAVICLDKENYPEELNLIWGKIGESHAKRKITQSAFHAVRDIILEVLTEVCPLNEEELIAWKILFENSLSIVFKKVS